jgi:hypothetical protein
MSNPYRAACGCQNSADTARPLENGEAGVLPGRAQAEACGCRNARQFCKNLKSFSNWRRHLSNLCLKCRTGQKAGATKTIQNQ